MLNHVHVRMPVLMSRKTEKCSQFDNILVMKHRLSFTYFVAEFEKESVSGITDGRCRATNCLIYRGTEGQTIREAVGTC
jgi:hypothetical protein